MPSASFFERMLAHDERDRLDRRGHVPQGVECACSAGASSLGLPDHAGVTDVAHDLPEEGARSGGSRPRSPGRPRACRACRPCARGRGPRPWARERRTRPPWARGRARPCRPRRPWSACRPCRPGHVGEVDHERLSLPHGEGEGHLVSSRDIPRKNTAIGERGHLVVGHRTIARAADHPADLFAGEGIAVALGANDVDRTHEEAQVYCRPCADCPCSSRSWWLAACRSRA